MQSAQTGGYQEVLRKKGFQSFLWMQFLNALNDNVYKLAVSLLAIVSPASRASSGVYLSLAGFIFVAPFLFFSNYAGQLADRYEKRRVVIVTKAIEIAAMLLATLALTSGRLGWMLAVLFVTATQAAFFSPVKYGILPELVEEQQLSRANGLLEMSTFVAIILGTIVGTKLVAWWQGHPAYIGFTLVLIGILGTWASLRVPRTLRPDERRTFVWDPFADVLTGLRQVAKDRLLLTGVAGTTFFWFLGALFQMVLLLFAVENLHSGETQSGLLLASLAIGIGVGSMAAGRWSGNGIEAGLVPLGAFGMALSAFAVACAHSLIPACVALAVLGFMGGLFIVPLNAILQHRSHPDEKGRVLGTANLVNTIGIMAASGLVWLLHEALHLRAATVINAAAVITLAAAVVALAVLPQAATRFLLSMATRCVYRIRVRGAESAPQSGPALLVSNHVSFVDGFLIGACTRPLVRFLVHQVWFERFRPFFRFCDAICVPGTDRRALVHAMKAARKSLQAGDVVCIFAEGILTPDGNLCEFRRGLEHLVEGLDVPVIPVHLDGMWGSVFSRNKNRSVARSLLHRRRVTVSFGAPMHQPSAFDVRQRVAEMSADAACESRVNETLASRFIRSAKRNWSKRALTELSGMTLTYGQALTASRLLARKLDELCGAEKMTGILLPACPAAALTNLGTVLSGRVVVNLNFTAGPAALESAISQCGLKTVITSRRFLDKAKVAPRPEMVFAEDLLQFSRIAKLTTYIQCMLMPGRWLCARNVKASDTAAVLFSSGSTGTPKGIMLSHRNLLANTDAVFNLFEIGRNDAVAGVLPLFHSFGFTYTLWFPLLNGAAAAYHSQPLDAKGVGELVHAAHTTVLPAPPTFLQAYLRVCSKEQFSSLRCVLTGAERLSPGLAQAFENKFGLTILEGYGATEMSPVIALNAPDIENAGITTVRQRPGTVGRCIGGVAAKVVSTETGEPCKPGARGLLLVKGANRMLGYLNRPEESRAALQDDWYVTGDIVSMDASGFIAIVDRQARFSKIGGEMAPHGAVEGTVENLFPGSRCFVSSVADERRGERLAALVSGQTNTRQEIWQVLMKSELPKLWIPKQDDIHVIEKLPLLGSGKIDLAQARRLVKDLSEEAPKAA